MLDFIKLLISFALGILIVGGILVFYYQRQAQSWQRFKPFYGKNWKGAVAIRKRQSLLLYSMGDFSRNYPGIVTIGVFPEGIGIRFMPLLVPFHDPIFVPYEDIEGWQQHWYVDAKSVELSFKKVPDLRIIMPSSQIDLIAAQGFANIDISLDEPSTGNWPYARFFSAIFLLTMMILLLVAAYIKADGDWSEMWSLLGPGKRGGS